MKNKHNSFTFLSAVALLAMQGATPAAIIVPGADDSDGVFAPVANIQIDLYQAADRPD